MFFQCLIYVDFSTLIDNIAVTIA